MKTFFKYFALSFVGQVILCVGLSYFGIKFPELYPVREAFLHMYVPMIIYISDHSNAYGESRMIGSIVMGILTGMFLYSIFFGLLGWLFSKIRSA